MNTRLKSTTKYLNLLSNNKSHIKRIQYGILLLVLFLSACSSESTIDSEAFVKVNDATLTRGEVLAILPEGVSAEDSARMVNEYSKSWVKQKLLLQKAELNIGQDPEIRRLVDTYKEQLLTEHYLRLMVEHKADVTPTEEQITEFYESHKSNYVLSDNILKGIFVVLPLDASNKDVLKQMLTSEELDKATIEAYCLQNAAKVDFFLDKWVAFRNIKKHLPAELTKTEKRILSDKKIYEVEDSLFHYILKVDDYKLQNQIAPLSYVHKELEEFLLNNNKVIYLQKMENDLYDEAERKGLIKYNN